MPRVVLHVAPHPDDEALGAPCTLLKLRDLGARVIVVACGLGRPGDHHRRLDELRAASAAAGFELIVRDPPAALGSTDDLEATATELRPWVTALLDAFRPDLVVGPDLHDVHPAHETVARVVRDVIAAAHTPPVWWTWGIWADLPMPTILVPASPALLARAVSMLDCYAGELARNDYPDLLRARARLAAVRGVERVFGFGSRRLTGVQNAELLTELSVHQGTWRVGLPRRADRPCLPLSWSPRLPAALAVALSGGDGGR